MGRTTYYVVQPYGVSDEGDLFPREPQEARNADSARRTAKALAQKEGGALAFSRAGDPSTGDFEEAVILGRYGLAAEAEVPVE